MFAVIKTGGKQYVVREGDVVEVEKLGLDKGGKLLFDQVLLLDDGGQTTVGTPLVDGAAVLAEVLETFKDDKILVFKKKRRKQFRRTRGHRQTLTKVKIARIFPDRASIPADALAVEKAPLPPAPEAPAAEKPAKAVPKAKAPAKKPAPAAPAKRRAETAKDKAAAKPKAAKAKAKK